CRIVSRRRGCSAPVRISRSRLLDDRIEDEVEKSLDDRRACFPRCLRRFAWAEKQTRDTAIIREDVSAQPSNAGVKMRRVVLHYGQRVGEQTVGRCRIFLTEQLEKAYKLRKDIYVAAGFS